VGDQEVENGTVTVRRYGEKDTQSMSAEDFIKLVQEKIASKKSAGED
jgi:threonyl-tRNA synthetase